MNPFWEMVAVCALCAGPAWPVDGKTFDTLQACRNYALERLNKPRDTGDTIQWWCQTKQRFPDGLVVERLDLER